MEKKRQIKAIEKVLMDLFSKQIDILNWHLYDKGKKPRPIDRAELNETISKISKIQKPVHSKNAGS
jgi:hypothetical protein